MIEFEIENIEKKKSKKLTGWEISKNKCSLLYYISIYIYSFFFQIPK